MTLHLCHLTWDLAGARLAGAESVVVEAIPHTTRFSVLPHTSYAI